ncbi:uncharacterized protein LOC121770649 [Salvia splendens]|uniref:uncharacterized protein LOC121770649 n=1 Tax=Salvia splendens TaxID=180675 RepID=UPI001C27B4B1|nr:uncharacterized protein LOC121770649 [Salvia splendens]
MGEERTVSSHGNPMFRFFVEISIQSRKRYEINHRHGRPLRRRICAGSSPEGGKVSKKAIKSPRAKSKKERSPPPAAESEAKEGYAAAVDREGEMSNTSPKLGSFYEFFSLSHLTPPLQCNLISFSFILF